MSEGAMIEATVLLTASDIARVAGVGPSAVSNWRRREADFPPEAEEGLFDEREVLAWLRRKGKQIKVFEQPTRADLLWKAADRLRVEAGAPADGWLELILQLVVLRAASDRPTDSPLQVPRSAWSQLEPFSHNAPAEQLLNATRNAALDENVRRALQPPHFSFSLNSNTWGALLGILRQLEPSTNWAQLGADLLDKYADRSSRQGAEFLTGDSLIELMSAVLSPLAGSVYDPACGASRFLATAWRRGGSRVTHLYGQEVNEQSWRLGYLNLLLQGAAFTLRTGDTLESDQFFDLRADRICLDPPFGQRLRSPERLDGDPRWRSVSYHGRADLLWFQHAAHHLADGGLAAVTVPMSMLFASDADRRKAFRNLIERDLLDAIVELPPGMLSGTRLPCALLCMRNGREKQRGTVLFVDARQLGSPERGGLVRFDESEVDRVRRVVDAWRAGHFKSEVGFASAASAEQIEANAFLLSPNRYIDYGRADDHIDGEAVDDRLKRLLTDANDRLAGLTATISDLQHILHDQRDGR
jgi:hypothetical protein